VKISRSHIISAIAFACLFLGALEVYDPVAPKTPHQILRTIENATHLPVAQLAETLSSVLPASVSQATPRAALPIAAASSVAPGQAADKAQAAKENADPAKIEMTLKSIQFKGITILGDMELKGIVEPFLNKPLSYEQMLDIGTTVEGYYRKNNYLARAILPPQDLEDGILTVEVIESVLSKVEVEQELEDLPNTQQHIAALIKAQQKPGEPLNTKSVDRALALANDVPGMSVQGALREGREAGETDLILKLYQGRTRQAEFTVDNAGSRATGAIRYMLSLNWFNPNDIGDLLNIMAVHTEGSEYMRMAYSIPVGLDGWRMGVNLSAMKYDVIVGEQGMVGAFGKAITQGLEWIYPLLRADDSAATVTLSADKKTFQNTSAQGLVMSDYQSKVLSAQISGFYRDLNPGGSSGTYSLAFSHGGINLDGSLSQQTDANTVRTEGVFNKIRLNSTWQKALSTQTSAFVSYTAQLSDKNLDSSEKMQLGGVNGVRAYPTGEGSGSDAQLIQFELRHQLESGVNMSAFYDWGQVWLQHDPNYPGGPANNRNTYKGFGASVGYTTEDGVNLKATWARKHGSNPNPNPVSGNDMDGTRDRNRYWIQLSVPF